MGKYPKARVVPFSSIVGSSVTLHDPETERVIGQLAILNTGGDTPEDRKQRQIAFADDTAKRINCHDELAASLSDMLRIIEAVKLSAGLGAKQIARMEAAKAVLAKAGA